MNILALDIGGTAIKSGLFLDGILTDCQERPSRGKEGIQAISASILDIIASVHTRFPLDGVGVSMTGQISPEDGRIIFATDSIPFATGYPLGDALRQLFPFPIAIDNDVNCAAVGEGYFGSGKKFRNFLCLTYGTGIGGAIVIDRKVFYGKIGIAGEVGHMITHAGGLPCVCGKKGCYEMYGSTNALLRRIKNITGEEWNGRQVFEHFSAPSIRSVIDEWIDEIVWGLVSLLHIFNPDAVILGGGILEQAYVYEQIVQRTRDSVLESFRTSELVRASLGNLAGIYGAYQNASDLLSKKQ